MTECKKTSTKYLLYCKFRTVELFHNQKKKKKEDITNKGIEACRFK